MRGAYLGNRISRHARDRVEKDAKRSSRFSSPCSNSNSKREIVVLRLIVAKKKKEKIVAEETRRFRIDSLLLLIGGSGLTRSIPGGEVRLKEFPSYSKLSAFFLFPFQLIFSGEYTKAMSKDWHSGHFCCWQCDESLTGQRYVLRDEHPYCIKCYESVFANGCEECNKIIGIDSKVRYTLLLHDSIIPSLLSIVRNRPFFPLIFSVTSYR